MADPIISAAFDYKYGTADWRADAVETFQKTKEVRTKYTSSDGQLIRTVETTTSWASGLAEVATNPITGPPYLYADGQFHADVSEIFQVTQIKTSTYEEFSENSYQVTIDTFDVLKNKHTITHQIIDGKIPLAPTRKSSITALILRPLVGQLLHQCSWVPDSVQLDLPWAENSTEMGRAAKRQWQRDSAPVRVIQMPANPLMKLGHTVRRIDAARSTDCMEVIVGVKHTVSSETGKATTELTLEHWARDVA